jgi:magnesium transporter
MKELKLEIIEIIANENDLKILREKLQTFHPYDIASILEQVNFEERAKLYAGLNDQELADIFSYLEMEESAELFLELDISKGVNVLEKMEVDDAVDLLQEINTDEAKNYLSLISSETREDISYLSRQQKASVGSIMTTNYIEIACDSDIKEAMKILVHNADETEVIDPLYVTEAGRLVGVVDLKTLIIARSPMQVREIMKTNFIYVDMDEEIEDAAGIIRDYGLSALPVLDRGKLVGIITIDDAIDVIEDEVSYHYGNLAGVTSDIDEEVNIFASLKKRLPWSIGLVILSFLTSTVIGSFEDIIQKTTILIFFQSLILDMVGNIGTQSLAVTIRGLSRGELDNNQELKENLLREFRISLINSVLLAILTFLVVVIFLFFTNYQGNIWVIGIVLSISMFMALNAAALIGVIIPILFEKIGIDPAVASGPFITTISDIFSVLIYYGLATLLVNLF